MPSAPALRARSVNLANPKIEATRGKAIHVALAQNALELMNELGVERFSVVGRDWGARTGYTLAALARCDNSLLLRGDKLLTSILVFGRNAQIPAVAGGRPERINSTRSGPSLKGD